MRASAVVAQSASSESTASARIRPRSRRRQSTLVDAGTAAGASGTEYDMSVDLSSRTVSERADDGNRHSHPGVLEERVHVLVAQGDAAVGPVLPLPAAAVNLDQAADAGAQRHLASALGVAEARQVLGVRVADQQGLVEIRRAVHAHLGD